MSLKNVLIYGGSGALGRACVTHFKAAHRDWKVVSVDLLANKDADTSIELPNEPRNSSNSWSSALDLITSHLDKAQISSLDALVCVAGGWCGGNATDKSFLESVETSLHQSLQTSAVAAGLAASRLNPEGLLVLTGAQAALSPTPGMIGYGLTKAAIHHLVGSLGSPGSGLAQNVKAVAILPLTLDTPMNRKSMPGADFSTWTPLEHVAHQIGIWALNTSPIESGSLFKVITQKGTTSFVKASVSSS